MPEPSSARRALYDDFVPAYIDFARCHCGRRTTHQLELALDRFFRWLAERGVTDLQSLTVLHVRDFVPSLKRFRPGTLHVHASALRGFLRYLHLKGILDTDLAHAVERPRCYQWRQPPRVLDSETIERLLASLDRTTAIGKRDYAMLILGARYGLRVSDIRSLRFENIRWREQQILLLQSKTQQRLELPLLKDVASALIDYIRRGRPTCAAPEIFLRHVTPVRPLGRRNNLRGLMKRALETADVDWDGPVGFQLLRHSVATGMLVSGVPFHTIAAILGHRSMETTRRYAQVDLPGLRAVVLSRAEVCQ